MTLEQTIVDKASGVLPDIPGESLPEQLWNGRQAAVAAVEQYVDKLTFDSDQAEAITSEIDSWMDRNRAALEQTFDGPIDPHASLEPSLQLVLEKDKMQQWIIGQLTLASEGLGPWMSGRLAQEVANPASSIDDTWAREDADMRLEIFGMILRLEESGELRRIFTDEPPSEETAMVMGAPFVIPWGWIVLFLLGAVLIISAAVVLTSHLKAKTAVHREMCLNAQRDGDEKTVRWCLKVMGETDPVKQVSEQLGRVVIILGGGFLLVRFGLPFLLDLFEERRSRPRLEASH
jgi:hypothetical protein